MNRKRTEHKFEAAEDIDERLARYGSTCEIKLATVEEGDKKFAKAPEWLTLMKVGEYADYFRRIKVTEEHFEAVLKNFKKGVIRRDLFYSYRHDDHGQAACWIRELRIAEEDGAKVLQTKVKWTKRGKQEVEDGEWRYTSAWIDFAFEDPLTGEPLGPTLKGATLTNDPFIDDMNPISKLSKKEKERKDNETMELKEALDKITNLEEKLSKIEVGESKLQAEVSELKMQNQTLEQENEKLSKEIVANKKKAEQKEHEDKFNKMLEEGKVVEAQREPWMKRDFEKFASLAGTTNTKPAGTSESPQSDGDGDVQDKILKMARERMKSDSKLSMDQAIDDVLDDNEDLREAYNKATGFDAE